MTKLMIRTALAAGFALALTLAGPAARADYTVTFDDLTLAPNTSHINGAFTSGGVGFNNRYFPSYNGWSGFAYSNINDTTTPGYTNDTAAITGTGHGPGQDIYGVAGGYRDTPPSTLAQLQSLPSISLLAGTSIAGMFVTNTTYAYLSMLNGDSFAKKFGGATGNDPDYFKITAYGTNSGGTILGTTVDFYLADFRSSNNAQDYILKDWAYWDLSALAGASNLYFNVSSSDVGPFGLNTPAYFAVDDIRVRTAGIGAVPEPASVALVGLGVAGVGLAARRGRRRAG